MVTHSLSDSFTTLILVALLSPHSSFNTVVVVQLLGFVSHVIKKIDGLKMTGYKGGNARVVMQKLEKKTGSCLILVKSVESYIY